MHFSSGPSVVVEVRVVVYRCTYCVVYPNYVSVGYHRYLIVARELNTLVLELDVAMTEMERPLFITSETTVAAGELSAGAIAVQVTPTTIVLAQEGDLLETTRVDTNFPIAAASIVDPYIALLTQNGRLILYRLEAGETPHLTEVNPRWQHAWESDNSSVHCRFKSRQG